MHILQPFKEATSEASGEHSSAGPMIQTVCVFMSTSASALVRQMLMEEYEQLAETDAPPGQALLNSILELLLKLVKMNQLQHCGTTLMN